jgi:hypothetical protein
MDRTAPFITGFRRHAESVSKPGELFPSADLFTLVRQGEDAALVEDASRSQLFFRIFRMPRSGTLLPACFIHRTVDLGRPHCQLDAARLRSPRRRLDPHLHRHTERYVWNGYETYRRTAGLTVVVPERFAVPPVGL